MRILYNSRLEKYKKPFGCVKRNQLCEMALEVPQSCPVDKIYVVLQNEFGFTMSVSFEHAYTNGLYEVYKTEFSLPKCGLYHYYFRFETPGSSFSLYKQGEEDTNMEEGSTWQLTCYPENYSSPEEFRGAVVYQIFPDRFSKAGTCDVSGKLKPFTMHEDLTDTPNFLPDEKGEVKNNDFFGGNLNGIIEKLPYLKSFHVSVLYLNPICFAFSNHRYDTADYKRIDPMLGTEDDFKKLCSKAHELGIKVILDGVFSHTGSNSIYFDSEGIFQNGAVSNENSPYKSWYTFDDYPVSYTSWWGIKTLPCVNEMDPSYLNYILYDEDSVVKYWLSLGADGFRLDVADELPDAFISELRKTVKAIKPQALVLGEVWEDASNKVSYNVQRRYFSGGELDSVMNYPFYKAIVEFVNGGHRAAAFQSAVMAIAENYPKHVLDCVMNSLSTHDTVRILTLLGDDFQGSKQEKAGRFLDDAQRTAAVNKECAAAALQFTLPGMACIFYGDEAGLEGFEDPFNRRFYPWGRENQELLSFYREISTIKAEKPVYRDGRIEFEDINENTVCFSRCRGSQRIYTAVNAGENPVTLAFTGKVLLMRHGAIAKNQATLAAFGIVIWEASE